MSPAASFRRFAVIDIGTVTCRMLVADVDADNVVHELLREYAIANLGEGVDATHRLKPAAIERVAVIVERFLSILYALPQANSYPTRVIALATSASRDAQNADEFERRLGELGVTLQVIPGEEFAAVVASVKKFMNNGYIGDAHLDDNYLAKLAENEAIFLGMPLLNNPNVDVPEVAKQLNALYSSEAQQGVVAFMGHGNPDTYDTFKANVRYEQLEEELQKFSPNYFVGTVDMPDNYKQDVWARMKTKGINSGKVYLHALMSIAGDHAHNDMAGEGDEYWDASDEESEDNSWFEFFSHKGYDATVPVTNNHPLGLLELSGVLNVWINHTKNAEFLEDAYHSMYPEE